MPVVTVYKIEGLNKTLDEVVKALKAKTANGWFVAKPSKYSRYEVFVQYYYYEDVESSLKRVLPESDDIITVLKQNGKTKVLKRVTCFISFLTKTLEVYRGPDSITEEIASQIEQLLGVKLNPLKLSGAQLEELYKKHGIELRQAMFKHVDGLLYETLRGSFLESNKKFKEYLQKFKDCLRVISFRPNIHFVNGGKYQVTVNGDKGSIRFSEVDGFKWRPRVEIRQLVFLMAVTAGMGG